MKFSSEMSRSLWIRQVWSPSPLVWNWIWILMGPFCSKVLIFSIADAIAFISTRTSVLLVGRSRICEPSVTTLFKRISIYRNYLFISSLKPFFVNCGSLDARNLASNSSCFLRLHIKSSFCFLIKVDCAVSGLSCGIEGFDRYEALLSPQL